MAALATKLLILLRSFAAAASTSSRSLAEKYTRICFRSEDGDLLREIGVFFTIFEYYIALVAFVVTYAMPNGSTEDKSGFPLAPIPTRRYGHSCGQNVWTTREKGMSQSQLFSGKCKPESSGLTCNPPRRRAAFAIFTPIVIRRPNWAALEEGAKKSAKVPCAETLLTLDSRCACISPQYVPVRAPTPPKTISNPHTLYHPVAEPAKETLQEELFGFSGSYDDCRQRQAEALRTIGRYMAEPVVSDSIKDRLPQLKLYLL